MSLMDLYVPSDKILALIRAPIAIMAWSGATESP